MIKNFDAAIDPSVGQLILTGELRPEGHAPLIPIKDTPFQLMRYKVVLTPEGSVRFTFNIAFIGMDFERDLMAEKKAVREK